MSRTTAEPEAPGALPARIARYQVLRRLATGGMAEVLLGRARSPAGFDKLFAIKRMLPALAGDPAVASQLLDEARIAAGLSHANVVQLFDAGLDDDGKVFLVMEYLQGRDLRGLSDRAAERAEQLALGEVLSIGVGVSAGLHYLHERSGADGRGLGLVHRDVSPHNVFVTFDGAVKLIDFGITKQSSGFDKTRFGLVKGKPGYMSPEQCRGEPVDRRSDIFSLSVVLYELTTGKRPFPADTAEAYFDAVLGGKAVPPGEHVAGYSPDLERLLLKGLSPARRDRFATALEMQRALETVAASASLPLAAHRLAATVERLFPEDAAAWRGGELGQVSREEPASVADGAAEEAQEAQQAEALAAPTRWLPRAAAGLVLVIGASVLAWSVLRADPAPGEPSGRTPDTAAPQSPSTPAEHPAGPAVEASAAGLDVPTAEAPAPAQPHPATTGAARARSLPARADATGHGAREPAPRDAGAAHDLDSPLPR